MAQKKKKGSKTKSKSTQGAASMPQGDQGRASSDKEAKLPQLPMELILDILEISAYLSGTQHARNVCLVTKVGYQKCWPSLHRIVALRTPGDLTNFARLFLSPTKSAVKLSGSAKRNFDQKQSALRHLYINNNSSDPEERGLAKLLFIKVLSQAENLQACHLEEQWSTTNE